MTRKETRRSSQEIKAMMSQEEDFLRPLIKVALQEMLEAEMSEALGAQKGERTEGRVGYRSGYYVRSLVTRVGKLELRVPQDRQGRFCTQLFERYQRSEKALVAALAHFSYRSRVFRLPGEVGARLDKPWPMWGLPELLQLDNAPEFH